MKKTLILTILLSIFSLHHQIFAQDKTKDKVLLKEWHHYLRAIQFKTTLDLLFEKEACSIQLKAAPAKDLKVNAEVDLQAKKKVISSVYKKVLYALTEQNTVSKKKLSAQKKVMQSETQRQIQNAIQAAIVKEYPYFYRRIKKALK